MLFTGGVVYRPKLRRLAKGILSKNGCLVKKDIIISGLTDLLDRSYLSTWSKLILSVGSYINIFLINSNRFS